MVSSNSSISAPLLDADDVGYFRLRGHVGGLDRSFLIGPGEHLVGSLVSCDIALPVTGVSRRHAQLQVTAEGVAVRDLGSRNGTTLNGDTVKEGLAKSGDRLRFGPVWLGLQAVARDDVRLAVDLHAGRAAPATATSIRAGVGNRLEHLADIITDDRGPDRHRLMLLLVEDLGCIGGALLLAQRDMQAGEPWVETTAGLPMEAPTRRIDDSSANLPAPLDMLLRRLLEEAPPGIVTSDRQPYADAMLLLAVHHDGDGEVHGLALWGESSVLGEGTAAWLRASLQLLVGVETRQLQADDAVPARHPLVTPYGHVRGTSAAMRRLYQQIAARAADADPVCLIGEPGTGKSDLVQALHLTSRRRGPLHLIDAVDVLDGLAPSFDTPSGNVPGTLVIDRVDELSTQQLANLRTRLEQTQHPNLRQPVLTLRIPLDTAPLTAIDEATLRWTGAPLIVPPLRERPEDIPRLIVNFLRAAVEDSAQQVAGLTVHALDRLCAYPWPGNVRELAHEVQRLVYHGTGGQPIDSTALSPPVRQGRVRAHVPDPRVSALGIETVEASSVSAISAIGSDTFAPGQDLALMPQLDDLARRMIRIALRRSGGDEAQAAKQLGMSRFALWWRMRQLGIRAR
ncbi:MAG: FHA domain-containing protein [Acidobacteriota bacterium]